MKVHLHLFSSLKEKIERKKLGMTMLGGEITLKITYPYD